MPDTLANLKEPEPKERKFEDVVKSAEQAAMLVRGIKGLQGCVACADGQRFEVLLRF
jgi:hypothetical protein